MAAFARDNDFSLSHYRKIVKRLRQTHQTMSFRDAALLGDKLLSCHRYVLMRHDVEFSLTAALTLAEIDASEGVRSTFFLLQTGDYNCFSEDGARAIRRILALGHDLGLHYDAGLMQRLGVDRVAAAQAQVDLFETFFDTHIYAMSAHLPARSGVTFALPGLIDVYDDLYFNQTKYISDSLQRWREGVVTRLLDRHDRIHLLTHECNWSEDGLGWEALMQRETNRQFEDRRVRDREAIASYREGLASRAVRDARFRQQLADARRRAPVPTATQAFPIAEEA